MKLRNSEYFLFFTSFLNIILITYSVVVENYTLLILFYILECILIISYLILTFSDSPTDEEIKRKNI